ncbi:uncharacterized protein LOC132562521 [Ylistrum balloti]|uniref:uncharacterized protein LOC132562521 n=1 Tax=Ylistrum balloti TaxID=509963 RepID=UPI002905F26A|nr:uncharacterized protein LOC132562521 [Ylistrum balloti]
MLWSVVFVLGPMSVLTLPTTTQVYTDPPAATNPTVSSVPLPQGELELILDTLLTQVDRHNTWLETLQEDVYGLGDSVELHSLDLQKLKEKFHKINKEQNKSSKQSREDSKGSDEHLLSLDKSSWDKSGSSQDSSNYVYDEEDWELFRNKEYEFMEKYGTNGNRRSKSERTASEKNSEEEKTYGNNVPQYTREEQSYREQRVYDNTNESSEEGTVHESHSSHESQSDSNEENYEDHDHYESHDNSDGHNSK